MKKNSDWKKETIHSSLSWYILCPFTPDTVYVPSPWYYAYSFPLILPIPLILLMPLSPWHYPCPFPMTLSMLVSPDTTHSPLPWYFLCPFPPDTIHVPFTWHCPPAPSLTVKSGTHPCSSVWKCPPFLWQNTDFSTQNNPFFGIKHWLFSPKWTPFFYGKTLTFQIKWTFLFTVKHWTSKLTCFSPNLRN